VTRRFTLSIGWAVDGRTIGRSRGAGRVLCGALIWFAGGVGTVDGSCLACDVALVEKLAVLGSCLWVWMCVLNWVIWVNWDRRVYWPLLRDDIVFVFRRW